MIYPPKHTTKITDIESNIVAHTVSDEYILAPRGGHHIQILARHAQFLETKLLVKSRTQMEDPSKISPFRVEPWMKKKYEGKVTLEYNFIESFSQREPSASALFIFTLH